MSLNPNQTAQEEFRAGAEKRQNFILALNYLELPPFPWKVIPFSPGLFNLNELPAPIDFDGDRGVIFK